MNIVITGGTKGIGRAIADIFAEAGHHVVVCARNEKDLQQMYNTYVSKNWNIQTYVADLSDKATVIRFAHFVKQQCTAIDVLVNNVGQYLSGTLETEPNGTLEKLLQTNVYSAYYLTQALLTPILKSDKGHIFNICSVAGLQPMPDRMSYTISKYAMRGFSQTLREELKPKGIKVTTVYPSATHTAAWQGVEIAKERLIAASDIAVAIFEVYGLSRASVVEELVIRPQLGDV